MTLSIAVHEHADKSAPALVMIHGLCSAATAWKQVSPYLQSTFTIVTLDLPGHGLSGFDADQPMDPKSLAQLIVQSLELELGIENFHLVGNSWGGWVSLEIAALFPDRVESVTALAPAGFWAENFDQRFPGESLARAITRSLKVFAPTLLKFEWARKIAFQDASPGWRDFSYQLCLDALNAMAESPGYSSASDGMLNKRFESEIDDSVPVTIIFGDSDTTLPALNCQDRAMSPAHAEWVALEKSGHAPMWDQPEAVARHILAAASKSR